jgi:alkylation response protein AidB-like acyl-CoA dehydrogenase
MSDAEAQAAKERNESVRLIRDSAAGIVPRTGDLKRIRALRFSDTGFDRAVWTQICDMGWPALRVPEEHGGAGLGLPEYVALAEEFGAALTPEPLIHCVLTASALRGDALAALLSGQKIVIPAWQERANSLDPTGATAIADGAITGQKMFIPMAAGADAFLVTSRQGLALVARDAPGLTLTTERTQDGGNFGTLSLADTPCTPIPGSLALEEATLATAAMLLGIADRAFAITLDYLKTRRQFGRPIGSFQSLQHRAADLKIQLALLRASVEAAAAHPTRSSISRAKARAAEAAMLVTRQAIQLHGGIGYTDEADIGLFLRRAMVLANLHGSASLHRARYAAITQDEDDA